MKLIMLPLLFITNMSLAAEPQDSWKKSVAELISEAEKMDPNTKSHEGEWKSIRQNLEQVPNQVESENGFKLSVQSILDRWGGLYLRVLDRQDAQYWALTNQELNLPRAWFSPRGPRWYVRYDLPESPLRRGDAVMDAKFSPFSKEYQEQKEWVLSLKGNPMKEEQKKTIPLVKQSLGAWSLEMTQKGSQVAMLGKKRLCFEKVWVFLSESVAKGLASKLQDSSCQGVVIDLRDSFGEGLASWPTFAKKIPTAVLINHETREGAVALAQALKANGAQVFGEKSSTPRLPAKVASLKEKEWLLLGSADGGRLKPDQEVKDSFMFAEGFDDVKEAAIAFVKKKLE